MSPLYDPGRHQPLGPGTHWNPDRAIAWLRQWSRDALNSWSPETGWPLHARDASDFDDSPPHLTTLYCGEAGIWLALARLAAAGYCELPVTPAERFAALAAAYASAPDTGERVPSWYLGESGLLTALSHFAPEAAIDDRLETLVRANRENPTREALWGAPGTMVAALFRYEASGEERWRAAYLDSAAALWESWFCDAQGVWLWEQDMYGRQTRYVGAGHGWAGNMYALWRGHDLLAPEQQASLRARCFAALQTLAIQEQGLCNWPALTENPERRLVQWCHGSPGIITALRPVRELPADALELLRQGGELILQAGPLAKGVSLCHGTDGNGVALLELWRRTGDARWLEGARRFAMAAIAQSEALYMEHRQWRYSLWTGDAGLACYLLDCLDGAPRGLPGLDAF